MREWKPHSSNDAQFMHKEYVGTGDINSGVISRRDRQSLSESAIHVLSSIQYAGRKQTISVP